MLICVSALVGVNFHDARRFELVDKPPNDEADVQVELEDASPEVWLMDG